MDEFECTPLRDPSNLNWHGMVYFDFRRGQEVCDVLNGMPLDPDLLSWLWWDSDVPELSFAGITEAKVRDALTKFKALGLRCYIGYFKGPGIMSLNVLKEF